MAIIMTLKNWLENRWLTEHETSPLEISELLEIADRDLKDCHAKGLTRILHKSEASICKAFRGDAVVCYRKPLITQKMDVSGLPKV